MSHGFATIHTPKTLTGFVLGCCLAFTFTGVQSASAHSATLQWAANTESDLAGYRVYHGTTSGVYGPFVDVGNTTIYTAQNLQAGVRHYFAITAYDHAGNESLPSSEVNLPFLAPSSATIPSGTTGAVPSFTDVRVGAAGELMSMGDLNGDGKADIIWRHTVTGDVVGWLMNGLTFDSTGILAEAMPLAWALAGVGDLNGDRRADIIWRDTVTGDVAGWLMNGLTLGSTGILAEAMPPAWALAGVGDLNGDRRADIIWRHTVTGDVAGWLMNGLTKSGDGILGKAQATWSMGGIDDVDGDGKADIVWRHTLTGDVAGWLMNGLTLRATGVLAEAVPVAWELAGVGDLNGDARADIVLRNTDTRDVAGWLLNGLTLSSTGVIVGSE